MKKYVELKNLADFPELDGVWIEKGNLYRTFCKCGYSACGVSMLKCPNCGNTRFQKVPGIVRTTTVERNSNAEIVYEIKRDTVYGFADNGSAVTQISKRVQVVNQTRVEHHYKSNQFIDNPLLDGIPYFEVARIVFRLFSPGQIHSDNFFGRLANVAKSFHVTDERTKQDAVNRVLDVVNSFTSPFDFCCYINRCHEKSVRWNDWLQKVNRLKPAARELCMDGSMFSLFPDNDDLKKLDVIPDEVLSVVMNYYLGGYIKTASEMIDIIIDSGGISQKDAAIFVKFFKEMYTSTWEIRRFIYWLRNGNSCDSVKDFYLQNNIHSLRKKYKEDHLQKAFANVYEDPVKTILELANC